MREERERERDKEREEERERESGGGLSREGDEVGRQGTAGVLQDVDFRTLLLSLVLLILL